MCSVQYVRKVSLQHTLVSAIIWSLIFFCIFVLKITEFSHYADLIVLGLSIPEYFINPGISGLIVGILGLTLAFQNQIQYLDFRL